MPSKPAPIESKTQRLEVRVGADQKRMIELGATLRGQSVTDFLVQTAAQATQEAIEAHKVVQLTLEGQLAFAEALRNPPKPGAALRKAFARRAAMLGEV
jgi:uncharacterized protein (DUF1778 family)